ncbi:hypothetical protein B0T17DRAFT_503335 [Bombardia bombarda]|uniref:Uncharacterized protein n=1 Tax=Bombardia bombarda TaxID=252184 RepID=A0AA39XKS3_9PEZI|nr:hypothetical protein B0T17DRAFT_503335 [Bombardia bombarda]
MYGMHHSPVQFSDIIPNQLQNPSTPKSHSSQPSPLNPPSLPVHQPHPSLVHKSTGRFLLAPDQLWRTAQPLSPLLSPPLLLLTTTHTTTARHSKTPPQTPPATTPICHSANPRASSLATCTIFAAAPVVRIFSSAQGNSGSREGGDVTFLMHQFFAAAATVEGRQTKGFAPQIAGTACGDVGEDRRDARRMIDNAGDF